MADENPLAPEAAATMEKLTAAIYAIPRKGTDDLAHFMPSFLHTLFLSHGKGQRVASLRQAQAQLRDVQAAAASLSNALAGLSEKAMEIFSDIARLKSSVRILGVVASYGANATAEEFASMAGGTGTTSKPAPPAVLLALDAAVVFATVSGARPTLRAAEGQKKYGPYLDFVTAVFEARDIPTKRSEDAAKTALRMLQDMEKHPPKNSP